MDGYECCLLYVVDYVGLLLAFDCVALWVGHVVCLRLRIVDARFRLWVGFLFPDLLCLFCGCLGRFVALVFC